MTPTRKSFSSIRGVHDILPGESERWQAIERAAGRLFAAFGFREIRLPIFEATELFARGIGEATDIVEKEMYTFADRSGESVTLRPEGTAPAIRAFLEHHLGAAQAVTKLYYWGPMFRYERPQKGRFRQFYQIGAEIIGSGAPEADVELLALLHLLFERLKIDGVRLELNSLGDEACRPAYRQTLQRFLESKQADLCENCRRRTATNPLRVLDCKNESCREATADAPMIVDHLCEACRSHHDRVTEGLAALKIVYHPNPRLVRGLDYYNRTTFEWTTTKLGAQNAVVGGGRYDGLVALLGGDPAPAIGFALGMERMAELLPPELGQPAAPDLFMAALGEQARAWAAPLVLALRKEGYRVETEYGDASLKSQMRRADKTGARWVCIVGENELTSGQIVVKNLQTKAQETLEADRALDELRLRLASLPPSPVSSPPPGGRGEHKAR
ncbi:MAG: histidine--tRNA ligase [Nitrospirae bacterium]|nr:histidine--tRNA ligase [Nitrospirota bacterium]